MERFRQWRLRRRLRGQVEAIGMVALLFAAWRTHKADRLGGPAREQYVARHAFDQQWDMALATAAAAVLRALR